MMYCVQSNWLENAAKLSQVEGRLLQSDSTVHVEYVGEGEGKAMQED